MQPHRQMDQLKDEKLKKQDIEYAIPTLQKRGGRVPAVHH